MVRVVDTYEETSIEFPDLGFSVAQAWVLQAFGE